MVKVLLTSGRSPVTLDLARQFHRNGHEVFVVDSTALHVSKVSNAVKKCYTVPSPRFKTAAFIEALINIVEKERIDFLIPVWEDIFYIASQKSRFPPDCTIFCDSYEKLITLHDKWRFVKRQEELSIPAPKTKIIRDQEDLNTLDFRSGFILKRSFSRASQDMFKLKPGAKLPPIRPSRTNPWLAQEWIEGSKFCTYSIARDGALKAHGTYPLDYAIEENSCLTFSSIQHPEIKKWVADFVRKEKFTGQIAFDFIQKDTGELFAIECNPRGTSGVHLFKAVDRLDLAILNQTETLITPSNHSSKQILFGMLIYGWKKKPIKDYLRSLFFTKDVIFCKEDLRPFLFQPAIFLNHLCWRFKYRQKIPAAFTFDLNWNGDEE